MPTKTASGQEEMTKPSSESRKPRASRKPAQAKEVKTSAASLKPAAQEKHKEPILAVVLVRGMVGTNRETRSTLAMLRLSRVNHCVLIPKSLSYQGMLEAAKYMVTWGEIDRETLEKLVAKRGRFSGDKRIEDSAYAKELVNLMLSGKGPKEIGLKPVFRLSPPSKGYRSTKLLFPKGSLGYRGEKMNELLKRMI